jgi:drug/metabolite transporter (DMT)-like permease
VNAALAGGLSALCLGTADFAARFATRAWGAANVLLGVFATSFILLSVWAIANTVAFPALGPGFAYAAANGLATAVMTVLLYLSLARGPIAVAAPIVASHPAFVAILWFAVGEVLSVVQVLGMAATILGVIVVARSADRGAMAGGLRPTIVLAAGACAAYVALVMFGQLAAQALGAFEAIWLGRGFSLSAAVLLLPLSARLGLGPAPVIPARAWAPLAGMGALDAGGYLFLFAGSLGDDPAIAAVTGSAFGAVTVLLARVILKEKMSVFQWAGIALVTVGIAVLAGHS